MAKFSLSPTFLKEVILLFKERSLKEILFGKKTKLTPEEEHLISSLPKEARTGKFNKIDVLHKADGKVYLLPNKLGDPEKESLVIVDPKTVIKPGPDLYIYLSTNSDIKKDGLGEILDLGLIKGTKGGHSYRAPAPMSELKKYKSVVVWCKQFAVLFSYATLS